jgi:drug/metabolite transporter (DMT)-like permease
MLALTLETDSLGQIYSLLAALTWAFALILFKKSCEHVPPLALNLFKNTLSLLFLIVTVLAAGGGWAPPTCFGPTQLVWLALSGIVGIALADTLVFRSLRLIGVSLFSLVDCLYSPMVVLFAWLLLSERLMGLHYLGATLILAGVFMSSGHKPPANRTRAQLVGGIALAAVAMIMMAFAIVSIKPVLELSKVDPQQRGLLSLSLLWANAWRLTAGNVALVALTLAGPNRRRMLDVFRPAASWKFSVPAAFLGTYLALIFWVAGYRDTHAAVAGILNQTSVIFALLLAWLILKEPLTKRKLAAVGLAMGGVVCVALS